MKSHRMTNAVSSKVVILLNKSMKLTGVQLNFFQAWSMTAKSLVNVGQFLPM